MLKFIRDAFSANTGTSFARLSTACTIVTGIYCLVRVVLKTNALPDASATVGLGTFMVAPYAIGKTAEIFNRGTDQPRPSVPPDSTLPTLQAHAPDPGRKTLLTYAVLAFLAISALVLLLDVVRLTTKPAP